MRESRKYGSVQGALSNERPYRDRQPQAGAIQQVKVRPKLKGSILLGSECCASACGTSRRFAATHRLRSLLEA